MQDSIIYAHYLLHSCYMFRRYYLAIFRELTSCKNIFRSREGPVKCMAIKLGRDSSVGIATRYELDRPGIESRWKRDFQHPSRPALGTHPASCTMGTWSFPGVKRPGRDVDHPPPSSAEVKERVQLYLYSPSGPSWPVIRWTFTFVYNGLGSR
jgi:hypothetical protein